MHGQTTQSINPGTNEVLQDLFQRLLVPYKNELLRVVKSRKASRAVPEERVQKQSVRDVLVSQFVEESVEVVKNVPIANETD